MKLYGKLAALLSAAVMLCSSFTLGASAAEFEYSSGNSSKLDISGLGAPGPAPVARPVLGSAPKLKVDQSYKMVRVSWGKVKNAEKYYIYQLQSDGSYKKMLTTKKTAFTVKNMSDGSPRTYKVTAVKGNKGRSSTIQASPSKMQIYRLYNDTQPFSSADVPASGVTLRSGLYAGYVDTINYKDYCVIYARDNRFLVKTNSVSEVTGSNSNILSCGSISQLDGTVFHGYACGPGAATIFYTAETGRQLTVERIITDAQRYKVTVYSDYTFLNDGMPVKGVKELVDAELSRNGIGKSAHLVSTASKSKAKLRKEFKALLDKGHRVLVCLCEDSSLVNGRMEAKYVEGYGVTHYVVITGYDTASDGTLYFYTGDSWYYEGDAYEYARNHDDRNRTAARYYYGLVSCPADVVAGSVRTATNMSSDLAGYIYIE